MKKKDLIYCCASEAVFQARIELLKKFPRGTRFHKDVDRILSVAQEKAGRFAVEAYNRDARKIKNFRVITG